ncbi:MAG: hypothetical protein ACXU8N_08600 [Telluria sp.]
MDEAEQFRRVLTAIASAPPGAAFGAIIESERAAFQGMHVTYATRATELHLNEIRLDKLNAACPLLHSLFDGTGLLFYSDEAYSATLAGRASIILDYSIMLDKNVCEEIRRYVRGKQPSDPVALGQLLRLVRGRRENFNYDFMNYLAEEYEHFTQATNDRPLQTFYALKRLDYLNELDLAAFPTLSTSAEIDSSVQRAVEDMVKAIYGRGAVRQLFLNRKAAYAVLLQAAILRWEGTAPLDAMTALVELSVRHLGKLTKIELYFGWKLVNLQQRLPAFFRPIERPKPGLRSVLRGMAWDLTFFRSAEILASMPRAVGTLQAEFFVPLIASADTKFRQMVAACPLKAIVIDRRAQRINSVFRDELDFQEILDQALAHAAIDRSPAAQQGRWQATLEESELDRIIQRLENQIEA